ncbi:MAG TPA: hypothetical protein VJQ44_04245 [Gemmatimonadales bacterium]|nr:hypothetical protein [Gemmatimonadales bacterium]
MTASTLAARPHSPLAYVLAGGVAAGALDISYAWLFWAVKAGIGAQRIFQSVAAGLLGKASFSGGWPTAFLGLGLHFFIATSMSLTYYLVARRRPFLREHPLACGAGYGLVLYGIMNFVVVPLSAASGGSKDPLWVALSVAVHMLFIGIPIALFTRLALEPGPGRAL